MAASSRGQTRKVEDFSRRQGQIKYIYEEKWKIGALRSNGEREEIVCFDFQLFHLLRYFFSLFFVSLPLPLSFYLSCRSAIFFFLLLMIPLLVPDGYKSQSDFWLWFFRDGREKE